MTKLILYAALLWFLQPVLPAGPSVRPVADVPQTEDNRCGLPGPSGVAVTLVGSTYITLKWDPVPGAAFYRLRTYDSNTDTLVSNLLIVAQPSDNSGTAEDLLPGATYSFSVTSVCSNGYEAL